MAILNDPELLFGNFQSFLCAKIKSKPTETVTDNFIVTKAGMFELTKPDSKGLSSRVQ